MKQLLLIVILALIFVSGISGFQPQNRPVHIFMVGDSTMADKDPKAEPERGWGQALQALFDDTVKVSNHAVNGRSSKSFIDEGRWEIVLSSLQSGDYVIIQFGHNDQKPDEARHLLSELGPEKSKSLYLYAPPGAYPDRPGGVEDDTHLNFEGAAAVARMAVEEMKALKLPLADHLRQTVQPWSGSVITVQNGDIGQRTREVL
jgi:lysophospholipase L1-like esterase